MKNMKVGFKKSKKSEWESRKQNKRVESRNGSEGSRIEILESKN